MFDFVPQIVFVVSTSGSHSFMGVFVNGQNKSLVFYTTGNASTGLSGSYNLVTWSGNSVSWYNDDKNKEVQLNNMVNYNGVTYNWLAIG